MKMRTPKEAERWKEHFAQHRRLERCIRQEAADILASPNFRSTRCHIQHGNMTVNAHCRNVARTSLVISEALHIRCNRRALIRGALLHDYFLYDWHDPSHVENHRLHGFYHPGEALKNASKEFRLSRREKDIIIKHMWPLTIIPPTCREAWIVTTADKWCSLLETLRISKGHGKLLKKIQAYENRIVV